MRIIVAILALLAFVLQVAAADPGFYKVSGVAAGDVLNIRSEPVAEAEALGSFQPGDAPVEVLEVVVSGGSEWGRVHSSDSDGYVSMKFLEPVEVATLGSSGIADGLACSGTEPFWNVRLSSSEGLVFEAMAGESFKLEILDARNAIGRQHRFAAIASDGKTRATAMIGKGESCSDGMSERNFSWRIDMLVERAGDSNFPQLYEGCCRLVVKK